MIMSRVLQRSAGVWAFYERHAFRTTLEVELEGVKKRPTFGPLRAQKHVLELHTCNFQLVMSKGTQSTINLFFK